MVLVFTSNDQKVDYTFLVKRAVPVNACIECNFVKRTRMYLSYVLIRTLKFCHVLLCFCGSGTRTLFLVKHWGWQNHLSVSSNVLGMFWACSKNWLISMTKNDSIKNTTRNDSTKKDVFSICLMKSISNSYIYLNIIIHSTFVYAVLCTQHSRTCSRFSIGRNAMFCLSTLSRAGRTIRTFMFCQNSGRVLEFCSDFDHRSKHLLIRLCN